MDLSLFAEVAGLGLAAVDAIGLAFMPILLAQSDGLRRALVFLLGSFLALMTVGMLFTTGLGSRIADLNERHPWLEPGVQVAGGVFLVGGQVDPSADLGVEVALLVVVSPDPRHVRVQPLPAQFAFSKDDRPSG